jgi:AraC-like DNA-binding protein
MVNIRERPQYLEFRPPQALSDRLLRLWTLHTDSEGGEHQQSVYPDGCVDIVWIGSAAPVVAGPATRRMVVGLPAGTSLFGVRFQPGWAASSLGLPAYELLNQDVPLADIWGRGARPFVQLMLRPQSVQVKLRSVSAALANRLAGGAHDADPMIRAAVPWLVHYPAVRVGDLARLIGLSGRQLQRRFHAAVGYGPKVFQRIMRFQRLLAAASESQDQAQLAGSLGYADQAHMCREVREFAGESPRSLLGQAGTTLSMSDLFNTDGRRGDYL